MSKKRLKLNFSKLSKDKKLKLISKIFKKLERKKKKTKNSFRVSFIKKLKIFITKLKSYYPSLLKKVPLIKLINSLKKRKKKIRPESLLKKKYIKDARFLTKKLKKLLSIFPKVNRFKLKKISIQKKFNKMNRVFFKRKLRKNISRKTYFFKIIRKKRRRKLKLLRLNINKPIFTLKFKKERKFLFRARESLLKTKKFLYRKQFPKIKGKKNKNFNFYYYNNMDRAPFKFHIGRLVITYLLNNTFINIHNSKKMLKVLSAGKIGFKGPKRSTSYSRQVVARKAIKFLTKTKLNVLDIFLNSNYNRWYYFLFKEISKPRVRPYVIRYLVISNPRPHGFIRDRKHRRK